LEELIVREVDRGRKIGDRREKLMVAEERCWLRRKVGSDGGS
jgi:hypothetical protein